MNDINNISENKINRNKKRNDRKKRLILRIFARICISTVCVISAIALFLPCAGETDIMLYENDIRKFVCSHSEIEDSPMICVYLTKKDEYINIPLEEFTVCSLYTEMSYLSPIEALKAQAVAIRSYCLYKTTYKCEKHPLADVCDDHTHCLGYIPRENILNDKGDEGEMILKILGEIAESCKGEYLSYNGEYADAMFHDSSYERTESYSDLYGKEIPYLVSVESNENTNVFKVSFSLEELMDRLSVDREQLDVFSPIIGEIVNHEESGRVKYIHLFGKKYSGNSVRFALGLTSTSFTVSQSGVRIVFTSYGNGHGIGMSQSGAKKMAHDGYSYDEILYHYYPGCRIES